MIGYSLAILIGLTLGMLGGGGSILTVPILVYVLKMPPKLSIALSLAIVCFTSMFGAFTHFKKGNVKLKIALLFGPFAMIGTFIGAKISAYISGTNQLLLFAIVMLIASIFMFKGRAPAEENLEIDIKSKYPVIILQGIFVGILTGIVGVGGGFMIVPALVLLTGVSMRQAVGTSLLIIMMNSFSGFMGYIDQFRIPWLFLLQFSSFTAIGVFIGIYFSDKVPQQKLKKVFSIFLIIMGFFILYKNKNKLNFQYQTNTRTLKSEGKS